MLETYDPGTDRKLELIDPEQPECWKVPGGTWSEPSDASDRDDFTQLELSQILQVSDRTVRKYLARLREIYYWQVELLTLPNGRYSQFALTELVNLQQAIAVFVPLAPGETAGVSKNPNRVSFDAYRDSIWAKSAPEPELDLVPMSLVLVDNADRLEVVETLEESFETLADLQGSIGDRYSDTVASFRNLGEQLAADSLAAMSESFTATVNDGMKALSQTGKVSTRKKKP